MKAECPAKCGKRFVSQAHAEAHADREHYDWRTPRLRGWGTPFGFIDFKHPVTYQEAYDAMQSICGGGHE